jgi:hypothetical protein
MYAMKKILVGCSAIALSIAAACSGSDTAAPASQLALTMASAFNTVPAGYSNLNSSFVGDLGSSFSPELGMSRDGMRGPGPGFGLGLMGGGLFGGFFGEEFGRGFAPTDAACKYDSSTGLTTCGPTTRNGITVTRVLQFQTSDGKSQSAFDNTTNSVSTKITVTGTATRRDNDQSTVDLSSSQTVTGLAPGSTARTVNSKSDGTETTTGTSQQGAFTSKRVTSDAVTGLVIPYRPQTATSWFPYPTAGSISRSMSATVQITGQSPTTSTRSEVITYDGTATAKVVITQNGKTQNCTLPLPFGRLSCS